MIGAKCTVRTSSTCIGDLIMVMSDIFQWEFLVCVTFTKRNINIMLKLQFFYVHENFKSEQHCINSCNELLKIFLKRINSKKYLSKKDS